MLHPPCRNSREREQQTLIKISQKSVPFWQLWQLIIRKIAFSEQCCVMCDVSTYEDISCLIMDSREHENLPCFSCLPVKTRPVYCVFCTGQCTCLIIKGELVYSVSPWESFQYLLDWEGYGLEECSWLPRSLICYSSKLQEFHRRQPDNLGRLPGGSRYGCTAVWGTTVCI